MTGPETGAADRELAAGLTAIGVLGTGMGAWALTLGGMSADGGLGVAVVYWAMSAVALGAAGWFWVKTRRRGRHRRQVPG